MRLHCKMPLSLGTLNNKYVGKIQTPNSLSIESMDRDKRELLFSCKYIYSSRPSTDILKTALSFVGKNFGSNRNITSS